jgi:hypothetical protein
MAREGRGGVKGGRVVGFLGGQLCQTKKKNRKCCKCGGRFRIAVNSEGWNAKRGSTVGKLV